jgi:hypothetical protein
MTATEDRADGASARARRLWRLFEPIHAVTYFAPEARQEFTAAGLKGFWMGYFAGRAAPMGAVGPAVVNATFFNFAPSWPARALPDAWAFATPARVLEARLRGVELILDRIVGPDPDANATLARAAELARLATVDLPVAGRPLAAANAALSWPDPPALVLWQAATILREHRGDGHVAALVTAGLDGCDAHVSFAATGAVSRQILQPSRGWSDAEWEDAERRLAMRGWLDEAGALTPMGVAARAEIEDITDRLAAPPWHQLGDRRTDELVEALRPLARAVVSTGVVPSINPIGVPPPG